VVLRNQLVEGANEVRTALGGGDRKREVAITAYFARQAQRKNGSLMSLHRETFPRERSDFEDSQDLVVRLPPILQRQIARGLRVLGDLDAELPGASGCEQVAAVAAQQG